MASVSTDGRESFAYLLRMLRQDRGLTQESVAEASGLSVRAIRDLERGRVRTPQRRTAKILAEALRLAGDEHTRFLASAQPQRRPARDDPVDRVRGGDDAGAEPPLAVAVGAGAHREAPAHLTQPAQPAQPAHLTQPAQRPETDGGPDGAVDSATGQRQTVPIPAQLPPAVTDLTGREREIALIRTHAADVTAGNRGTVSVVALHGTAGVGKTSLAVFAGTTLRGLFPDGQLFVDLRGTDIEPLDSGEVLAIFLRAVGVTDERLPAAVPERAALFRSLSSRLNLLVVLDNALDEGQVRPLLPTGARCLVLVTSRRPLTGLECVDRIGLDLLPAEAGYQLLVTIVGSRIQREPAAARELVTLCGCLPLALRIAANRLATRPHWSVRHLVDRLRDQHQRLTTLTAGDLGVRAAIHVSYRQLEPRVAAMFRFAALIPGPDFGVDLAGAVCGYDRATAVQAADTLVDAGLLLPVDERYRFHDLVQLYARERLSQQPESDRRNAMDRMITWLLTGTTDAGRVLDVERTALPAEPPVSTMEASGLAAAPTRAARDAPSREASDRLPVESSTVGSQAHGATSSAVDGWPPRTQPAQPPIRAAAEPATPVPPRLLAVASPGSAYGGTEWSAGIAARGPVDVAQRTRARQWLRAEAANWLAAMREAVALGRHREVVAAARALHWYSDSATHSHPWTEIFGLGVEAAATIGSRSDEVVLLNFYGWALYLCAERYDEAKVVHQHALDLARELDDRREEAWALTYLAAIALRTGPAEEVVALGRRATTIFAEIGFALGQESALGVLGSGLAALGRGAEALEIHRAVLASYQRRRAVGEAGTEVGEAGTTLAIAQDLSGLGRYSEAAEAYASARALFRHCAMPYGEAVAAYREGLLLRDMAATAAALASLRTATALFAKLGAVSWELRAREAVSSVDSQRSSACAHRI